MPKYIITSPDGEEYEVTAPEGASEADVLAYAKQQFAAQAPTAPAATAAPVAPTQGPSIGTRIARGAEDPISGLAQLAEKTAPEAIRQPLRRLDQWLYGKTGGFLGNPYETFGEGVRAEEEEYQAQRQAGGQTGMDWARLGGNVAAMAPLSMAGPALPASLAGRTGLAAAESGLLGASMPVTEGDFWPEKAKQAGLSAAGGAVAAPVAAGVGRMLSPRTSPQVAQLQAEGITPSPGQIMGGPWKAGEEKLRSIPIFGDLITGAHRTSVNDLNRAAYNRALTPIGRTAEEFPVGREGVYQVKQALSDAYKEILPKLTFQADDQFSSGLQNLQQLSRGLETNERKQFDRFLREKLFNYMTPSGRMSGESLKVVEEQLGKLATGYQKDMSFAKRQLGDALDEALNLVRQTVERSSPEFAGRLRDINRGYANYSIIRDAASKAGTQEGFTAAQLAAAARASDKSVGKGRTATGQALMQDLTDPGTQVLTQRYPESGTPGRLMMGMGSLGAGFLDPTIPLGLLAGGGLYTQPAQRALAAAMTRRPDWMRGGSGLLQSAAPALGFAGGGLLAQ